MGAGASPLPPLPFALCGYLLKQRDVLRTWRVRWVVLHAQALFYFEHRCAEGPSACPVWFCAFLALPGAGKEATPFLDPLPLQTSTQPTLPPSTGPTGCPTPSSP